MIEPPMIFPIVTGARFAMKKLSQVRAGKSAGVLPIDCRMVSCMWSFLREGMASGIVL